MPNQYVAKLDADPKDILRRYLSDESTKDIAASYGVTRQALGSFLLKHAETEWKDAQIARALARKESAEDDLEAVRTELKDLEHDEEKPFNTQAISALALARLRACESALKAAQWDLERVCRRIYGQDAPTAAQAVQININLRRTALDVVEGQKASDLNENGDSVDAEIVPK